MTDGQTGVATLERERAPFFEDDRPDPPRHTRRPPRAEGTGSRARLGRLWKSCKPEAGDRRPLALFLVVLVAGALLRFWNVGRQPGWQNDETVYTEIGRNVAVHGQITEHAQQLVAKGPFLFHPPFYFLLLGGWFRLFGSGITQARTLSVVASLVMLVLLFRLMWKLYDARLAAISVCLVILDGWMIFVERISYIENTLMVLVVLAMICYQRAIESPTLRRYVIAGAMFGACAVFKQTGAYLLVVALVHFVITRRDGRGRRAMMGVAALIIGLYVSMMVIAFDLNSHHFFITDTIIQFDRTFGLRESHGTLTSPLKGIELLERQYYVFLPSLLVAVTSFLVLIRRTIQCLRARSFAPIGEETLLYSWSAGAIVSFGVISLRFPQYFVLVLVPMYCYLYQEAVRYFRRVRIDHPHSPYGKLVPSVIAGLVVALGLASATSRVYLRHDNVLLDVREYAIHHIPRDSSVVTLEAVGDEIPQPWCTEANFNACNTAGNVKYIITYVTFLQPNPPAIKKRLRQGQGGWVRKRTFRGFKETATVWELTGR